MSPRVSIVVPTRDRAAALGRFLHALRDQDVAPEAFEVVVAFDGPADVAVVPDDLPFAVRVVHLEQVGISAAKNAAVAASRGAIVLLANDDIIPDPGFISAHLAAHAAGHAIVLGDTPWVRYADDTCFDELIRRAPLVFFYNGMVGGCHYGFRHAWNLNLSVDRGLLDPLDGPFAEALRPVYYDDVEMAFRLMGPAERVFFHPAARAVHDHRYTPCDYFVREALLGVMAVALGAVNRACFEAIFRKSLPALAREAEAARTLDVDADRDALAGWLGEVAAPLDRPGQWSALYDAHLPLKRRAFRCGVRRALVAPAEPWTARFEMARAALAGDAVFADAPWAGAAPCG